MPQDDSPASSSPIGRGARQLWAQAEPLLGYSGAGVGVGNEGLDCGEVGTLSAQDQGPQNRLFRAA